MAEATSGWIEAVRQVIEIVQRSDSWEFALETGDLAITIRRKPVRTTAGGAHQNERGAAPVESTPSHFHNVLAPLTGVFFRSQTPSARPYCSEGDWVGAETVIGLIETMKIFNEVTADHSGRVVKFHAQVGELVQAGAPLVTLDPLDKRAADTADEQDGAMLGRV